MKLEEGMYARTKSKIIKINQIIENGIREFEDDYGRIFEEETGKRVIRYIDKDGWNCGLDEDDILKVSHNIIDLIKIGDYVNGFKVTGLDYQYTTKVHKLSCNNEYGQEGILIIPSEIRNVVTKEQFDSITYEVEK